MNSETDDLTARKAKLRLRTQRLTWFFIAALAVSGLTAIPLETELNAAARVLGIERISASETGAGFTWWILRVREAVQQTNAAFPFMAYGTDWLAFGHFVIAIAFIGAVRDPVRNAWLYRFGIIACVLVVPYALGVGALRGIPIYWRLIDCSFGIFGILPLLACQRWTEELSQLNELQTFSSSGGCL
jgi:hypothetical protein